MLFWPRAAKGPESAGRSPPQAADPVAQARADKPQPKRISRNLAAKYARRWSWLAPPEPGRTTWGCQLCSSTTTGGSNSWGECLVEVPSVTSIRRHEKSLAHRKSEAVLGKGGAPASASVLVEPACQVPS